MPNVNPDRLQALAEHYRDQAEFCRQMACRWRVHGPNAKLLRSASAPVARNIDAQATAQEKEWLRRAADWARLAEDAEARSRLS